MTTATAQSIQCRTCRAAIPGAARFCTFCGTPATPTPYYQPPTPGPTPPAAPLPAAKSSAGSTALTIFGRIALFAGLVIAKVAAREVPALGLAILVIAIVILVIARIKR